MGLLRLGHKRHVASALISLLDPLLDHSLWGTQPCGEIRGKELRPPAESHVNGSSWKQSLQPQSNLQIITAPNNLRKDLECK